MANRNLARDGGSPQKGLVNLLGFFTTTTTGTLSTVSTAFTPVKQAGFTLTKVGATAGRYLLTLQDKYVALLSVAAMASITGGAAFPVANGVTAFVRDAAVSAATPVLTIQFARTDTGADAEVPDGAIILIDVQLKNSSV